MKPANVILSSEGRPHLTDFGMVKDLDLSRSSGLTKTGTFLGTPGFWPPEQADGRLDQVGPASDVYALGATLYAALTGQPPFTGDNVVAVAIATRDDPVVPPSRLRPTLDRALEAIVMRCLEKKPQARYAAAADLSDALERWLAGERRAPRRWLTRLGLLAGSVALLGLTAGLGWRQWTGDAAVASPGDPPKVLPKGETPESYRIGLRANELNKLGVKAYQSGDIHGALALYEEAMALRPDFVSPWWNRGNVRARLGNREGALADYDRAIQLKPDHGRIYATRAYVKWELGDVEGALADYDRCLALAPKDALLYHNRGQLYRRRGELDAALADFNRAIELEPDNTDAVRMRGDVKLGLEDDLGAEADYTAAIEAEPDSWSGWARRGNVRLRLGNNEGALEDLNKALELNADIATAYCNRATARVKLGQPVEAAADLRRFVMLDPTHPNADGAREMLIALEDKIEELRAQQQQRPE